VHKCHAVSVQGNPIDRATQEWVRRTGRRIDLREYPWLDGPIGGLDLIGDRWVADELARQNSALADVTDGLGLLPTMSALASASFSPEQIKPEIADFYEHTTNWRLALRSQWRPAFWPVGWFLTRIFAHRLEQFSLPLRPSDVAEGMDSRLVRVVDPSNGDVRGTAWLRRLRSTGRAIYSGWYGTETLPVGDHRSVRVVFPLPNGSLTIFLRPEIVGAGDLRLISPLGSFGDDGAYLLVRETAGHTAWVRRVPLAEQFDVYVDDESVLHADHVLRLRHAEVFRINYRLERKLS
jgi:hypothetical protein